MSITPKQTIVRQGWASPFQSKMPASYLPPVNIIESKRINDKFNKKGNTETTLVDQTPTNIRRQSIGAISALTGDTEQSLKENVSIYYINTRYITIYYKYLLEIGRGGRREEKR